MSTPNPRQFFIPPRAGTGAGRHCRLRQPPTAPVFPSPTTGQATTALEMKVALPARPATESSPGRAASIW